MREFIIACDIDSTIGDPSHRLHFVLGKPKDYDSFYHPGHVMDDKPIEKSIRKLQQLNVRNTLYFTTGRPERLREVTSNWILRHFGIGFPQERMLMRQEKDFRSPGELKVAFFEHLALKAAQSRTRLVILDDEPRVLPIASQYGLALKAPECWDAIHLD